MFAIAAIFGGSFTLALSGALMPGPLLTVTISESARRGFRAGPLLMIGHSLLELVLVIAVIQGLGPYLKSPPVIGIISLFGGGVLIWLGVGMVRTAGSLSLNEEEIGNKARQMPHPVFMGIIASLSNPYWILWWATIGLGYLVAAMKFGVGGVTFFFLGHIAADFAWYSVISYGISRGKSLLKDTSYQLMIRICGLFLVGFGGWFLFSAKDHLAKVIF